MHKRNLFRIPLLLFIATMFVIDIFLILTNISRPAGSYHQKSINIAFRSAFGIFELVLVGLIIYFMVKFPARRLRLLSLLFFHVVGILIIPMALHNYTLMALTIPWPQTLLPFDRATPHWVLVASLITGFLIIPLITFVRGRKAFCGYICPIGGFYS